MLRKVTTTLGLALGIASAQIGTAQQPCPNGDCGGVVHNAGVHGTAIHSHHDDSFGYAQMNGHGTQPVFDNYFTRGYANQAEASLYISPIGVPGWVGHTYNTYQPLNPHHFLYQHKDRYHSYYDNGQGLNRTRAKYYAPPVRTAGKKLYKVLEIPR